MKYDKRKILFVDLDDVVVDYQSGFQFTSNKRDKGFFENMKPMKDAVKSVEMLSDHFNIYFLSTAPWSNPYSWTEKRIWIEKYFPKIGFKKLILSHNKSLLSGDYLIDDRITNGAGEFNGELILFGSKDFPNWEICLDYLVNKKRN